MRAMRAAVPLSPRVLVLNCRREYQLPTGSTAGSVLTQRDSHSDLDDVDAACCKCGVRPADTRSRMPLQRLAPQQLDTLPRYLGSQWT